MRGWWGGPRMAALHEANMFKCIMRYHKCADILPYQSRSVFLFAGKTNEKACGQHLWDVRRNARVPQNACGILNTSTNLWYERHIKGTLCGRTKKNTCVMSTANNKSIQIIKCHEGLVGQQGKCRHCAHRSQTTVSRYQSIHPYSELLTIHLRNRGTQHCGSHA